MSDVPVTDAPTVDWHEANKRSLAAEVAVVAALLERHAAPARPEEPDATGDEERNLMAAEGRLQDVAGGLPLRSALDGLTAAFGLSSFERSVVVLCAGMDLEGTFAIRCAEAQGDPRRAYPTFGLALAALPDPHWSAITPAAPLRRWRLVDVLPGDSLTSSPLRIDERVLHHLTGIAHLDERLLGLVWPVRELGELVPSHHDAARRVAEIWSTAGAGPDLPIVQLWGQGPAEIEAVAAHACTELDIRCLGVRASDVPPAPTEREEFSRLWEREAVLSRSALLVDADRRAGPDEDGAARAAMSFVDGLEGLVMISSREPVPPGRRPAIRVRVARSTAGEQRAVWRTVLGPIGARLNGQLDATVAQFDLGVQAIRAVGAEVVGRLGSDSEDRPSDERVGSMVWEACRAQARTRLDDLAQRIEPAATWDDLVLPNAQDRLLREIALHVRQRVRVYETWGFARRSNGGLGISALFAGPSGTGKTMAAEVLANELRLDLHRIDLSQVVSKYIGETEKNLRRVFDAAEEGGSLLLFDEADALFGKRSEVKDSHDRYANIEVSYLLQRMEAYRGLAILTTNMRSALDTAFLRRIRFIVQFPFPESEQRAEIWRRVFPPETPTAELEPSRLAQLNVAGGNIRNIAMNAAFLAADEGSPVRMDHLLRAARGEYWKLEKPLADAEVRGWT